MAEKLCCSERTLRRKYNTESVSFRTVLDDVKNVLAHKHLTITALDVAMCVMLPHSSSIVCGVGPGSQWPVATDNYH